MPGNTIGSALKITTWGESHGKGVGVVIDGLPPGILLDETIIQSMLFIKTSFRSFFYSVIHINIINDNF